MEEEREISADTARELEYLRQLIQKYGSHYTKGYFGFTMRDFAKRMGIAENTFSQILKGTRKMQPKYGQAFSLSFKELRVEERTRDFKESPSQLQMKKLYQQGKALLET